jgi:hypothetical protein
MLKFSGSSYLISDLSWGMLNSPTIVTWEHSYIYAFTRSKEPLHLKRKRDVGMVHKETLPTSLSR